MAFCYQCGMPCGSDAYHPYAACLMFRACPNPAEVEANLLAVRADGENAERLRIRRELLAAFDEVESDGDYTVAGQVDMTRLRDALDRIAPGEG